MDKLLRFLSTVLLLPGFFAGIPENTLAQPAAAEANKFLGNITTSWQVRDDFMLYWNQITGENEHKWSSVEGTRGQFNWTRGDRVANFARLNSIPWRFHTLIWGSQYPGWMNNLSTPEQLAAVTRWMDEAAARYPDVQMIDVVNEGLRNHAPPNTWKDALGGDGDTGWDWIINSFKMARERWPNAILKYNDYNIVEWEHAISAAISMLNVLIENDTPIDALGVQGHDIQRLSAQQLQTNLDRLAALGLPIFITEFDIPRENDQQQLNVMRNLFPVMWNHPSVVGITLWGYVVGSTWVTGTGLKHPDGTHRPAMTWLLDYVRDNPNPPNDFPDLMKTGGGEGVCPPTAITPRFRVDQGDWEQLSTAAVEAGSSVEISPLPETGGVWSWTGPGGFSDTKRDVTIADVQTAQTGLYTATHTNDCGAITMQAFSICIPTEITPRIRVNTGAWQEVDSLTVEAGVTVQMAPLPISGGTWSWTGPGGFNANTRTLTMSNIQAIQAGTYTVRHTNSCGAVTTQTFTITLTHLPVAIPGRVQAENFSSMMGIQIEDDGQGAINIGSINPGDWAKYHIDVLENDIHLMRFRVATGADENNNILVKDHLGALLGTLEVDASKSNGWNDWYIDSIMVNLISGLQELTLEFEGTSDNLFNIDWFELYPLTTLVDDVMREVGAYEYSVWAAPNPFVRDVVIMNRAPLSAENLKVEIYTISGEKIYQTTTTGNSETRIEESAMWKSGVYYIVLSNSEGIVSVKPVIKTNN
jgi:GH35 family endo-1,4-beta-xylanase